MKLRQEAKHSPMLQTTNNRKQACLKIKFIQLAMPQKTAAY